MFCAAVNVQAKTVFTNEELFVMCGPWCVLNENNLKHFYSCDLLYAAVSASFSAVASIYNITGSVRIIVTLAQLQRAVLITVFSNDDWPCCGSNPRPSHRPSHLWFILHYHVSLHHITPRTHIMHEGQIFHMHLTAAFYNVQSIFK